MGPKAFVPCIYCPWPLFTQQDLAERSPTRVYRDGKGVFKGLSQKKEEEQIKTVIELMGNAGSTLKLHHAMPTAIVFARRYYSVKSLQENDRFIVACACLFLAAKCEEEMRALNDVCYQTYKSRYNSNPEALKNMQNGEFFTSFKEIVLTAERSLLYALGFQLDIRHPYYWSTTILRRLGSLPKDGQPGDGPWWQEYSERTRASRTNFINDLYRRTTLVLRYDLRIIAFAVIHVTIPIMYPDIGRPTANHDKVPLIDLEPWYSYVLKTERPEVVEGAPSSTPSRASTTYEPEQKVTVSLLIEISKEIMSLYGKAKKGPPQAPGAAAKPRGPEMGPDGPITPLVEEFGTPRSDGSPAQVDAEGNAAADGAEPGSGAAAAAPAAKTGLNPAAPDFVPGAAQAPADSSAAPAPASAAADRQLPSEAAGEQPHAQRMSRKRSSDEAGLPEQASPSKRAAPATRQELSTSGFRDAESAPAASAQSAQPSADSCVGSSIPQVDMEVEPSASTASAEPQSNGGPAQAEPMDTLPSAANGVQPDQSDSVLPAGATALTNHVQPAGASDLANGLQPPEAAEAAPAMGDEGQRAPSTNAGAQPAGSAAETNGMQPAGAPALHGQPSVASEEGELLAEMHALEEPYQPQAAADPAAASERLKKWQAGQVQQKAEVEGSSKPEQPVQDAGADELEAELEGLDAPAQPKQAHTDPALASERRKKLQQQLQALNAQKAT